VSDRSNETNHGAGSEVPRPGVEENYEVIPGVDESPVIVHVPHAATTVPDWVRQHLLLDDDQLAVELHRMTDALTDQIAIGAASRAERAPWIFINRLSRVVIDPERFPDPDVEPMARPDIGMGAVYTRTSHLKPLRETDDGHHQALLSAYFHPYALTLADLVDDRLRAAGRVTIIDLHSFPAEELPYERLHHADAKRPALCLGTDSFHTPAELVELARQAFSGIGGITLDQPFAGTYVPLRHYRVDDRVRSIMIELRRNLYVDKPKGQVEITEMLGRLVDGI